MNSGKNILISILCLVVLLIGGYFVKLVFFPVATAIKAVDMPYKVADKTMTAENAIHNYEWFKNKKAAIERLYKQEKIAQTTLSNFKSMLNKDRSKWSSDDRIEVSRLMTVSSGIAMESASAISDYNAKSKMVHKSMFKDNLPTTMSKSFLARSRYHQ